jgi:tyrosine-specific transport protein
MKFPRNYFLAISTLVGTVIGAGIFALPILVNASGVWPFLIFIIIIGAFQYFFNKMYAATILATKKDHRIPGYVEEYAGKKYKRLAAFFCLVGGYGGLLAYLILGGIFLHGLLAPFWGGDLTIYSLALFVLESLVVLAGLKSIARAEMVMSVVLVAVVILIVAVCFSNFDPANIKLAAWQYAFALYGPIFFSLGGDAAIPEVCKLLDKEKNKIKSALLWGTAIPTAITAIFVLAVVGAAGSRTTADTLTGLYAIFDGKIIFLALIFGLVNIMTSFFTSLQSVRELYWWDFKLNKNLAWFLAAVVPLLLFILGIRNLTSVVSISGAVSGGVIGIIMIHLSRASSAAPQKTSPLKVRVSSAAAIGLSSFFVLGLVYELLIVFKVL